MYTVITAQPQGLPLALSEAGSPRVIRALEPGVVLTERVARRVERPIFLRHICPADIETPLTGEKRDIESLAEALRSILHALDAARSFSVQTRILFSPAYKRFDVNMALSREAEALGAPLSVKAPEQAISVTLAEGVGYIGISDIADNQSDWAGGARRFRREEAQVSRAEFKLLEALEVFGIDLVEGQRALDLGAAPGGWTRVLLQRGLRVTAVDPAALDARIGGDPRVRHFRGTAQAYFDAPQSFDVLVNDMKMDSGESSQLMAEGVHCLRPGGCAILTLKLPERASEWLPRVERARAILKGAYEIAGVRQLFHNRHEVTMHLVRR